MKMKNLLDEKTLKELGYMDDSKPYKLIKDLVKDEEIESIFKVTSKKLQEAKDGKKFLLLTFKDKTGIIRAIDWHNAELNDGRISLGDVVKVRGKVVYFENRLQLNLSKNPSDVVVLKEGEYDPNRFVETTKRSIKEMYEKLVNHIKSVKSDKLRRLLEQIFIEDRGFLRKFLDAPAGLSVHHAYRGGLLEHTLDVVELAEHVVEKYGDILNRDLLIAGAMLHDIGKAYEYEITPSGLEMTDSGELLGHIVIGVKMVERVAKRIANFPNNLLMEIEHMIISHHGEFEWGSPTLPKTPEALVLHMIDNLDAKLSQFLKLQEKTAEGNNWSEYDRKLGRRVMIRRDSR